LSRQAVEQGAKDTEDIRAQLSSTSGTAPMPEVVRAAAAKKLLDTEKRLYFNLGLTDVNGRIKDIPTLDMTAMFDTYLSDSGRPTIEHILSAIRDGDFELRQNVELRVDTLINRQAITTR
jgi:hypothetical protein